MKADINITKTEEVNVTVICRLSEGLIEVNFDDSRNIVELSKSDLAKFTALIKPFIQNVTGISTVKDVVYEDIPRIKNRENEE